MRISKEVAFLYFVALVAVYRLINLITPSSGPRVIKLLEKAEVVHLSRNSEVIYPFKRSSYLHKSGIKNSF